MEIQLIKYDEGKMFLGCRLGYDSLNLSVQYKTDQDRTYIKKLLHTLVSGKTFYGAEYTKHFHDDWNIACTHGLLKRTAKLSYSEAHGGSNIISALPNTDLVWLFYMTCIKPNPQFESHALFSYKSILEKYPHLKALIANTAPDNV